MRMRVAASLSRPFVRRMGDGRMQMRVQVRQSIVGSADRNLPSFPQSSHFRHARWTRMVESLSGLLGLEMARNTDEPASVSE
jgi:hypothetical protein